MIRLIRTWLLFIGVALVCAGCEPTNRLVWSPDGLRAVVLASDGLRVCDQAGRISEPLIKAVDVACWTPDSTHALAATRSKVHSWTEAAKLLSPPERKQALNEAGKLREAILSYSGSWDDFLKHNDPLLSSCRFTAEALLYLRENYPDQLKSKLKDRWGDIEKLDLDAWDVRSYELTAAGVAGGSSLYRTNRAVVDMRVASHGKAALIVEQARPSDDDGRYQISAIPLEGGTARRITEQGAMFPDWSADGRSLVYMEAARTDKDKAIPALGSLKVVAVCEASGILRKDFGAARTLAYVPFTGTGRIRCLNSGRIIFSSQEMALPCAAADTTSLLTLFMLDPDRLATATRLVPRTAESDLDRSACWFEVSPDETMVSIPRSSGRIAVLNVRTGDLMEVQPEVDPAWQSLPTIPQWRSSDELCFAAPTKKSPSDKWAFDLVVMNVNSKARQILSKGWAPEAVSGFLRETNSAGLPSK